MTSYFSLSEGINAHINHVNNKRGLFTKLYLNNNIHLSLLRICERIMDGKLDEASHLAKM